ncbi:hypothetical protein C3L33_06238, partial [Rhododendron williamsianum]
AKGLLLEDLQPAGVSDFVRNDPVYVSDLSVIKLGRVFCKKGCDSDVETWEDSVFVDYKLSFNKVCWSCPTSVNDLLQN